MLILEILWNSTRQITDHLQMENNPALYQFIFIKFFAFLAGIFRNIRDSFLNIEQSFC